MIKILLIDDDSDVAEMFGEALTTAGFSVEIFTEGLAALNSCVTCRYALVIADINMPDIDGASLLKMIRAQRPNMPYIFFSGQGAPRNSEIIQEADGFVLKIDGPKKLIGTVIRVLVHNGVDAGTSQTCAAV